jgi:hypothetical protein
MSEEVSWAGRGSGHQCGGSYLFVVGAKTSDVDSGNCAVDRSGPRERGDDPPVDSHTCVEPRTVKADVSRGDQQQASPLDALALQRTGILCAPDTGEQMA